MRSMWLWVLVWIQAGVWAQTDPLTLTPTDDTYLTPDATGRPGGRGERDEFQIYGGADGRQFRALLKFDLEQVKRAPTQALLRIKAWNIGRPKSTETIRCHALARAWSQKFASWDLCLEDDQWVNNGGDWDPIAVAGCNVTTDMGGEAGWWLEFDVTPLAQAWAMKQRPNYGLVLMLEPGSEAQVRVRSKEKGGDAPQLVLGWNAQIPRGKGMVPGGKLKPYGLPLKLEPVWVTESLNAARVGQAFTQKLSARGGARPLTYEAQGLPEGFTLSKEGELSGTGTKAGRYKFTATCTGADKRRGTTRLELVVEEAGAAAVAANPLDPLAGGAKPEGAKKTEKPAVEEEE